ncbi:capsular exopolysaccharide synthesis family protein [Sphingomonas kaistensis]|uniref:Capsular exopolysaccharide synthesis family protein n=1 Tax=Sphingomonas kaistensis TaxID=298708 RepID=A0A7X6BG63_9SPHN|nr:polysaccharide biosynthesis tyrosine autokinase [Sphingomonas kaistensis]NJC06129.1 capsular exopolysaccharide synthesis family protein [Sphingomonas kaistensis]
MNRDLAFSPNGRLPAAPGDLPPGAAAPVNRARTAVHHNQLDLASLLRIVREWRWLILAAMVLGLAGGIILTMLTTPLYRAVATLEVNPPQVQVLDKDDSQSQSFQSWDFIATQVGLLQSRAVAERTAQDLNLAANPAVAGTEGSLQDRLARATSVVAGGLNVTMPEEGTLIRYTYTSTDPQLAATIANGVADSFINAGLQRRFESSAYARQFLERQITKTRGDLERSEQSLARYAQAEGIITLSGGGQGSSGSPEAGNSLQGDSLAAINAALAQATARRVAAEGAYRASAASGPGSAVTASTQALRASRAQVEAEYSEKRASLQPDHPEMISLRERIAELNQQIAREGAQASAGVNNTLAAEYRGAAAAERALQARVNSLKGQVLDLRGRSVRYGILQREVDTNRSLYDALLGRYKEIGVAGGIGTSPISIVDRAEPAGSPFKPNLPKNLLAGLALGLIGGLGAAVGLDLLRDTIRTREDMRSKLGLACIGQIPKRQTKGDFVEDLKDPGSLVSEAYSATAAALRFTTEHGAPRVMMVTSTSPAEGKSSSALALAQNFARRGVNVLLIDADLRKPAFRAANDEIGLTKLLTNEEELLGHVAPTQFDNLSLLPCGTLPPNPADLLATARFGMIIEEALQHFQMVLVDSPPVMGLADAPLIAHTCRNVLFVVESARTRTRQAAEALNNLEASGAHLLGGLLTKASEANGNYSYYNYRYGELADKRERIALIPHHQEG